MRPRYLTTLPAALFVALLGVLLLSPAAGARDRAQATGSPPVDTIQFGPLRAAGGFSMYVTDEGCGSSDPWFQIAFLTGRAPDLLTHTYTGAAASCVIEHSAVGAEIHARLPGVIDIDADIGSAGPALRHPGLPVGCGAPFGPELPATATGTISVAIHPGVFGRIDADQAEAQIFTGTAQHCPATQPTDGRQLTATVGPYLIDASSPAHGSPQVDVLDPYGDSSASGLTGTMELQLAGRQVYALSGTAGSARIGAAAPFTTGALNFSTLPACPGDSAVNGTLTGTLDINDPLLGKLAINGSDASQAFSGLGTAQAGSCNGPGSLPMAANFVSTCDQAAGCSVSAATSTATFFDETDPGTQSIVSEQVDPGDGSAPLAISADGTATHTYAAPGTYTATLTVTDAAGISSTESIVVHIGA